MRIKLAVSGAVFLPILLVVAGHGETAQQPQGALERRVVELEKRVESLEKLVVQLSGYLPGIPPGARELEFNGMRYYLVPIEKGGDNLPHRQEK